VAVQDGFQAREAGADDTSVDLDFGPGCDLDFEDGEIYAVEGWQHGYETDDGYDACTILFSRIVSLTVMERKELGSVGSNGDENGGGTYKEPTANRRPNIHF